MINATDTKSDSDTDKNLMWRSTNHIFILFITFVIIISFLSLPSRAARNHLRSNLYPTKVMSSTSTSVQTLLLRHPGTCTGTRNLVDLSYYCFYFLRKLTYLHTLQVCTGVAIRWPKHLLPATTTGHEMALFCRALVPFWSMERSILKFLRFSKRELPSLSLYQREPICCTTRVANCYTRQNN